MTSPLGYHYKVMVKCGMALFAYHAHDVSYITVTTAILLNDGCIVKQTTMPCRVREFQLL